MNTPLEKVLAFEGGLVVDQREAGSGDVVVLRADITQTGQPKSEQHVVWRELESLMDGGDKAIVVAAEREVACRKRFQQGVGNFTVSRMTRKEAREKGLLAGVDVIFMP